MVRRNLASPPRYRAPSNCIGDFSSRWMALTQIPDSLVWTHFRYYRNAFTFSQGSLLALSPRLRWRLDRIREKLGGLFGTGNEPRRPQLCPACSTLVGANATRCHQCGASLTFSM